MSLNSPFLQIVFTVKFAYRWSRHEPEGSNRPRKDFRTFRILPAEKDWNRDQFAHKFRLRRHYLLATERKSDYRKTMVADTMNSKFQNHPGQPEAAIEGFLVSRNPARYTQCGNLCHVLPHGLSDRGSGSEMAFKKGFAGGPDAWLPLSAIGYRLRSLLCG